MSVETLMIFFACMTFVAFMYAAVGHGGASGYMATMALFGFMPSEIKTTALFLNLVVSLIAFVQFYREKYFDVRIFLPLAICSIPSAYIGGSMTLDDHTYKIILGLILILPAISFLLKSKDEIPSTTTRPILASIAMGTSIGFISGLIGIGGGILLSPLLIALKWTDLKRTAAISAAFIFVNSMAGILGQASNKLMLPNNWMLFIIVVPLGGFLGSYFGAKKCSHTQLRRALSVVLWIAAFKLILVK